MIKYKFIGENVFRFADEAGFSSLSFHFPVKEKRYIVWDLCVVCEFNYKLYNVLLLIIKKLEEFDFIVLGFFKTARTWDGYCL